MLVERQRSRRSYLSGSGGLVRNVVYGDRLMKFTCLTLSRRVKRFDLLDTVGSAGSQGGGKPPKSSDSPYCHCFRESEVASQTGI